MRNADSVIFNLISPIGSVTKNVTGGTNLVTCSASEMGGLSAGQGNLQIVPYNIQSAVYSRKTLYLINETVLIQSVTLN